MQVGIFDFPAVDSFQAPLSHWSGKSMDNSEAYIVGMSKSFYLEIDTVFWKCK